MSGPSAGLAGVALDWYRAGKRVVIATVVDTWGSAPRPIGSQLVIDGAGHMEGSVSGGCVEGAVIVEAIEALEDGMPRLLEYGVSDDEAFAVGLACGGKIQVLVEPVGGAMPIEALAAIVEARLKRRAVAYAVDLKGAERKVTDNTHFVDRFRSGESGIEKDGRTFVIIHNPPLRMVVVGGVHIAQYLLPMARNCGFDVTLVDPRPAFASTSRFPDTVISEDWPDEAIKALEADARTAVVTLTHDPKLDDPAIHVTLRTDVFYLGCLGSTRTHAKRVDRLLKAGFDADDIARIHAPVGLDIGGRSPAEIAVSIMAQVTERLHKG